MKTLLARRFLQPLPRYVFIFQALIAEGNEALLQWGYPVGVGSLKQTQTPFPARSTGVTAPRLTDTAHIQMGGWARWPNGDRAPKKLKNN